MKIFTLLFSLCILLPTLVYSQHKPAYQLYSQDGNLAEYSEMIKDLAKSDMVFFGEYHTNPIAHWLQLEVSKSLFDLRGDALFFGAEMFENGNQLVLDEYLDGLYPASKMTPEITQLWGNYQTDYQPLVDFAKANQLRFIATNIPRRYAAMLNLYGMEALKKLSPEALSMISPDLEKYFDPTLKAYAEMKDKMGGHVPDNMLNIQIAQASKDATMAYFSLKNFRKGNLLLHFQGSYHSNNNQGIIWWVHKTNPAIAIKSITTVTQSEWDAMEANDKREIANYIIVVADNMTQTKR